MIENLAPAAGGGVLATVILSALAYITRKSWYANQRQDVAAADAGTDVIGILREEVSRLAARVKSCEEALDHERAHGRQLEQYIWQLQALMREANIVVPPMVLNR